MNTTSTTRYTATRPGWVYLLRCGWYYKIGRAGNVQRRVKELQTASPFQIDLLLAVEVNDCAYVEARLHYEFRNYRTNGEWFELPAEAVDEVQTALRDHANVFVGANHYRWLDGAYAVHVANILIAGTLFPYGPSPTYRPKRLGTRKRRRWVLDAGQLCMEPQELVSAAVAASLPDRFGDYAAAPPPIGERVRHPVFGVGVVTGKDAPFGNSPVVWVRFVGSERRLIVRLAGLQRV